MDKKTYERWWPLHLRSARKEVLDPAEKAFYEAGLAQLDAEELLDHGHLQSDKLAADIAAKEAENESLRARIRELDAEIETLESALAQRRARAS